jgi:hypothetical protein
LENKSIEDDFYNLLLLQYFFIVILESSLDWHQS